MRWPFVPKHNAAGALRLALGLTHHEHFDTCSQSINLFRLCRDGVGQIIRDARQMRDTLFKCRVIHTAQMRMSITDGKGGKGQSVIPFVSRAKHWVRFGPIQLLFTFLKDAVNADASVVLAPLVASR